MLTEYQANEALRERLEIRAEWKRVLANKPVPIRTKQQVKPQSVFARLYNYVLTK